MKSRRLARTLLLAGLIIGLTGCFPMHFIMRPGISGTVVDDATPRPVVDTIVTLRMRTVRGEITTSASAPAATDAKGAFAIAPARRWGIYIVPMDVFPLNGTAQFNAIGYATTSRAVRSDPMGRAVLPLWEIRLRQTP